MFLPKSYSSTELTTGTAALEIEGQHPSLFRSTGHKQTLCKPALSKVGNIVGKASPLMMASDAAPVDVVASKEQPNKTFLQKICAPVLHLYIMQHTREK